MIFRKRLYYDKRRVLLMDNILETDLRLTHAPISIKDFNRIKKAIALDSVLWHEKESPIMLHSIS